MTDNGSPSVHRVGLILPTDNVSMEPELYSLGIKNVAFNSIRLTSTDHDVMRRQAEECGAVINELGLDAVVYACAETSFNAGTMKRRTMSEQIAADTGLPVITATDALHLALQIMGTVRIALLSPYTQDSGKALEATLAEAGIVVVSSRHHDFQPESGDGREWFLTNRVPPERVASMVDNLDISDADAIAISSTNLSVISVIPSLEAARDLPVVTTNQAIVAWCAQVLGFAVPERMGRLAGVVNRLNGVKQVNA